MNNRGSRNEVMVSTITKSGGWGDLIGGAVRCMWRYLGVVKIYLGGYEDRTNFKKEQWWVGPYGVPGSWGKGSKKGVAFFDEGNNTGDKNII